MHAFFIHMFVHATTFIGCLLYKGLRSQIFLVEYFSEISWVTKLDIVIFAKLDYV